LLLLVSKGFGKPGSEKGEFATSQDMAGDVWVGCVTRMPCYQHCAVGIRMIGIHRY
jgi:hypothetical protein